GYNIAGFSFTAGELVRSIQRHLPDFTCDFVPDVRQNYADSWPNDIEDEVAKTEWGWAPEFNLDATVDAMFAGLKTQASV
ncbi:MAG: NAD-dependent epimerase, partial [Candidatus Thermoplasmatota archaeon]|nr:NAD-dependent epimerase [Candidatus Thermoplasmatota archaeon]